MEIDLDVCIVCKGPSNGGRFRTPDIDPEQQDIPCCRACNDSGKLKQWWNDTVQEIRELVQGHAFEKSFFTGNPLVDVINLRDWKKGYERIKDGVCPNGCARLRVLRHGVLCPVCQFHQFIRKL